MQTIDYEYSGLMAGTWDLFRGDTSGWEDRFFFLEAIARYGQPVLDVGCGTGRLLLDLLAQGIDADGIDVSPEMLALLREKADRLGLQPTIYLGSMEEMDLPRRYQAVLVPSSSFQLLTDPASARRAMGRFFAHLQTGGVLVMPFMTLWQEGNPLENEWPVREIIRPEDGAVFRRWSRSTYDPASECESSEDRYEVTLNGEVIAAEQHSRSPATRSYTQSQAKHLYEEAGFRDVTLYSGFTWQPANATDGIFSVIGRRP